MEMDCIFNKLGQSFQVLSLFLEKNPLILVMVCSQTKKIIYIFLLLF